MIKKLIMLNIMILNRTLFKVYFEIDRKWRRFSKIKNRKGREYRDRGNKLQSSRLCPRLVMIKIGRGVMQ